jgi:hypothetical protein
LPNPPIFLVIELRIEAGFADSALELAGATTEQEKTELKKEWSELVRCIDLQKHSQEVATQLKEAKEQLKNANNGTITDLTMRQAATNEEVRAALWRRVAKDKKTLETKIKTLAEAGKTYDMSQADKEIMSRYEEMKAESKGDDDELSSISHAGKRGRGLLNCMQFISDQVSGMRALFAQEAEASPSRRRQPTLVDKLEELKQAKDAGFLTEDEFNTSKQQLVRKWTMTSP